MMKKLIALIMCIALLSIALIACGNKEDPADSDTEATESTALTSDTESETTDTEAPDDEPGPSNDPENIDMYSAEKDPYGQDLDNWD